MLSQEEKLNLVDTMKFENNDLWLKDFYLARIMLEVKQEENEGLIRVKISDANSSHL